MTDHLSFLPENPNELPQVAIITPNWNSHADTINCLKSIEYLDYPKSKIEIIIIDNGSVDGSQERLRDNIFSMEKDGWHKLTLIEFSENIGIPGAYNAGYKLISSDTHVILRIESDVILKKDSLKHMISSLLFSNQIGIVGATVRNLQTGNLECGALFYNFWTGKFRVEYSKYPIPCIGVNGCTMAIKRKVIDSLSYLFDDTLKIGSDETDLSFRLAEQGYSTWYNPHAVTYHKGGQSTKKIASLTNYYSVRNCVLLHRRYWPMPQKWICHVFTLLAGSKRLFHGDWLSFHAMWHAFKLPKNPLNWSDQQKNWYQL